MNTESSLLKIFKYGYDAKRSQIIKKRYKKRSSHQQSGGGLSYIDGYQRAFFVNVMLTTIVHLCLTYGTMYLLRKNPMAFSKVRYKTWGVVAILVSHLALVLLLALVPMPIAVKLPLYAILAVISGFVMDQCTKLVTQEALNVALVGTIGVFTTMLAVGYVLTLLGTDFTVLGMMLAGALVALMAWYVINPFLLKNTTKTKRIVTVVSLVIFSLFVAYDTNVILRRDYYGDFVTASLDYTLDFFHIFIDIATLVGNKQQVY